MLYVIIAALVVWVLFLLNKTRKLTEDLARKEKDLNQYTSENVFNTNSEDPYKAFERQRLRDQQIHNQEASRDIPFQEEKSTYKPSGRDISQEELLMHMGNKIPSELLRPKKEVTKNSSIFFRKKVCITGNFDAFPIRAELARHLWDLGADIDTGVGKTLDFLLCGDGAGPSKCAKAEEQNVRFIEEDELIELLPDFKSKYL